MRDYSLQIYILDLFWFAFSRGEWAVLRNYRGSLIVNYFKGASNFSVGNFAVITIKIVYGRKTRGHYRIRSKIVIYARFFFRENIGMKMSLMFRVWESFGDFRSVFHWNVRFEFNLS
jgi:hypothetical protein